MRDLPPALAAHLAEGVTTLCRCWRLLRRDGVVLGFTDHDRDLAFDGTVFAARSGFEAAEATAELGFAVGGGEVAGALSSAGITEADIARGLYDDASVETWLVNWAAPAERLLLERASIGEIRRRDGAVVAELRGPLHRFDEERGRLYGAACSAELGDARCRVELGPFTAGGTVSASDGASRVAADGLAAFASGWFTGGRLRWTGGGNAGASAAVRAHRREGEATVLDLWEPAGAPIAPGDAFTVSAGCDKRLSTCAAKFANVANHRGFPHMPGNAYLARVAQPGEPGMDGGSLFR